MASANGFQVRCPQCQTVMLVRGAGTTVACPGCKRPILVGAPPPAPKPAPRPAAISAARPPAPPRTPRPAPNRVKPPAAVEPPRRGGSRALLAVGLLVALGLFAVAGAFVYHARNRDEANARAREAPDAVPADKDAPAVQRQAEVARTGAAAEQQKHEDVNRLVGQGRAALAAGQCDEAEKLARDALKLVTGDRDAAALLQEVQAAKAGVAAEQKRREEFNRLLAQGRTALQGKQFAEAELAFAGALKLYPNDIEALKGQRDAQDGLKALDADQKKRLQLDAFRRAGRQAADAGKYDEAERYAADALKLFPDDPGARDLARALQLARERLQQEYLAHVQAARTALAARKWSEALREATAALDNRPGDAAANDLIKQAQTGLATDAADLKKREEFNRLLGQGKVALVANRYAEAEKVFAEALTLYPNDADALKGQRDAQDALRALDAEQRKRAQFDAALKAAREASDARKYDEAERYTAEALKLFPDDPGARDLAHGIFLAKERLQQEYSLHLQAARTALAAKKWTEALKEATAALDRKPGDAAANDLIKQAQAGSAADVAEQKKRDDFNRLLGQGKAALAAKKYPEAEKAFADALKLFPNDPEALKGQREAADAHKIQDAERQKQAQYEAHLKAVQAALALKKWDDAIREAGAALDQKPGDPAAQSALKAAQDGKAAAAAEQKRLADFNQALDRGRAALTAKKWDDALRAAQEALRLQPNDPAAMQLQRDAEAGKKKAADYHQAMERGRAALAGKKWDDALKAADDALKLMPGDRDALQLQRDAQAGKQKGALDRAHEAYVAWGKRSAPGPRL
jgi:tetratricopeptide (TPR) repeat protein